METRVLQGQAGKVFIVKGEVKGVEGGVRGRPEKVTKVVAKRQRIKDTPRWPQIPPGIKPLTPEAAARLTREAEARKAERQ